MEEQYHQKRYNYQANNDYQNQHQNNTNINYNGPITGSNNSALGSVDNKRVRLNNDEIVFDGKSLRKSVQRKTIDYASDMINYFENRPWLKDSREQNLLQVDPLYNIKMLPPMVQLTRPSNAITTKFISSASNKVRCPTNVVRWTPEGRRLITGCSTGEFTLWNGLTFNFETILQAHDCAVRAMEWSHNDNWMVTADHNGIIKYWQSNMNNLKEFQGHDAAIRGLSFSCTDAKFVTCSDDSNLKIFNFSEGIEENVLKGHAADVKAVDWHPFKALIASGSKDNMLKLWDPKSGKCLTTFLKWNQNGNWLVSTARDQLIKVFDIRMMKEFLSLRGHKKEVSTVAWHPQFERVFATGGSDGAIMFWDICSDSPTATIKTAHEAYIWSLDWHPVGHILVSGSNDHTTKFWTRPRPGELIKPNEARFHNGYLPPDPTKLSDMENNTHNNMESISLPGLGRSLDQPIQFSSTSTLLPPGLGILNQGEESNNNGLVLPGLDGL